MSNTINCGIIGCGNISATHAGSLKKTEGAQLTWVCDLVSGKAAALAEKFDVPNQTTDYRVMLADPDLVCVHVCTDHASHAELSAAALDAGKHVICEKALGSSVEGLEIMLAARRRNPNQVFCGVFQHRFDAVYRQLKRLVDDGTFGTILTAGVQIRCLRTADYYQSGDWRGTWDGEGGGVLINQAIHFVDALVWIMGGVDAVCGAYTNLTHKGVIETEDTVTASLRFRNGAVGTLEATSSSNIDWEPTISIHGSEGAVEVRNGKVFKIVFQDESVQAEVTEAFATCVEQEKECLGKSYYGPSHGSQIADFIESVRDGREPFVTAESARHTVDLVLAVYESSRQGKWIQI